jgi:hypothetical protein
MTELWHGRSIVTSLFILLGLSLAVQADSVSHKLLRNDGGSIKVITADHGGITPWYEAKFFGRGAANTYWVVDGPCTSACTIVLGTSRVCATPRAQFGFHAGHIEPFPFWKSSLATHQMYQHYPPAVQRWVSTHSAMDHLLP